MADFSALKGHLVPIGTALASFAGGVLLGLIKYWTAKADYDTKRTALATAQADYETKKTALETEKLRLDKERRALDINKIRDVFESCGCFGRNICVEVFCLRVYQVLDDALKGLEALKPHLKSLPPSPPATLVTWVQERLARFAEDRVTDLSGPTTDLPRVYKAVIECYATLTSAIKASNTQTLAINHCLAWMGTRRAIKGETIRTLLPALIELAPDNQELFSAFLAQISEAGRARTDEERNDVISAIWALGRCAALPPNRLVKLLVEAFHAAANDWRTYGDSWFNAVLSCVRKDQYRACLKEQHLPDEIAKHINGTEPRILEQDNENEYNSLVSVLASIQGRAAARPKNRHVVNEENVRVAIHLPSALGIETRLINFSVAQGTPGMFVLASPDLGWTYSDWRPASISVTRNNQASITIQNGEIRGPETHHHMRIAFRIRYSLVPAIQQFLEELARDHPLTR